MCLVLGRGQAIDLMTPSQVDFSTLSGPSMAIKLTYAQHKTIYNELGGFEFVKDMSWH